MLRGLGNVTPAMFSYSPTYAQIKEKNMRTEAPVLTPTPQTDFPATNQCIPPHSDWYI